MLKYPIAGPLISEAEINSVTQAVSSAWYDNAGSYIKQFANDLKKHCQRKYAILTPHCTSALHLALVACNISEGDEVIVPDCTWIASAAPISYVGATTVMVDIDNSWCIDINELENAITTKTKAIIAVNLYGQMANFDELTAIAKKYGLILIEDAAQSIGSTYKSQPSGSFGDISVFSFHGSKTITAGEGGALLVNDESLYDKICVLQDHGRFLGAKDFNNHLIGFKYKMTDLQAAMLIEQLKRLEEFVLIKHNIFQRYCENLLPYGFILNPIQTNVESSYWMSTVILPLTKEKVIEQLNEYNIATRPFFSPLSSQKAYEKLLVNGQARCLINNNAKKYANNGINLPSALCLTLDDIDFISNTLIKVCNASRRVYHPQKKTNCKDATRC